MQSPHDTGFRSGVIVLDPGHGGIDGGTGDPRGLLEKNINLKIALKLRTLLERMGYTVVMTRDTDVSLEGPDKAGGGRHARDLRARVDVINRNNTLLFLSIHVNSLASNPGENGAIVFYGKRFKQNRILAHFLQDRLNAVTSEGVTRARNSPLPGRYYILGHALAPGVIVETAFITNPAERRLLATDAFLDSLAEAIARGAVDFLKSESPS